MTLTEKVEQLQHLLVSYSTGGGGDDREYRAVRAELLESSIATRLPRFVRTCRDLEQFWGHIKAKFAHYQERRKYLWDEFGPALEHLEERARSSANGAVEKILRDFEPVYVSEIWKRALDRLGDDPEGAITLARSLLETVCKCILDDQGIECSRSATLPQLYSETSRVLNLAPSQHSEKIFRQILGGCEAVVGGLAGLRNRLSDSHGQGRKRVRPEARHARLAVNLAGSTATFLVETWQEGRGAGA